MGVRSFFVMEIKLRQSHLFLHKFLPETLMTVFRFLSLFSIVAVLEGVQLKRVHTKKMAKVHQCFFTTEPFSTIHVFLMYGRIINNLQYFQVYKTHLMINAQGVTNIMQ